MSKTEFEYGCSTTNKFAFVNEDDVEDPSDLLAQVTVSVAEPAAKGAAKKPAGKLAPGAKTVAAPGAKTAPVGVKKQPLQQTTDNKSGKSQAGDDKGKKPVGMGGPQTNRAPQQQQGAGQKPPMDKENTRRSGPRRDDFGDRPRRPQGQGEQQQRRPPRPPRDEGDALGGPTGEGGEGGFVRRSTGGPAGGFRRGPGGPGGPRRFREGGENRGPVGGRPPRRNDAEHPRVFDRHSGDDKTGVKPIDKKDGAGKSNWGTYNDELVAETEPLNETTGEAGEQTGETGGDWAARVDENEEGKPTDETDEIVPHYMTLDEYKKLKNEINKKNEFNIRRPGEGEDQSKWNKFNVELTKKTEEGEEVEDDEEQEDEDDEEEHHKKKSIVNEIQFKFYEQPRGGRDDRDSGRGGRGGPRRDGPPRREQRNSTGGDDHEAQSPNKNRGGPRREGPAGAGPRRDGPTGAAQQQQRRGPFTGGQQGAPRGGPKTAPPRIQDEQDFPTLGK